MKQKDDISVFALIAFKMKKDHTCVMMTIMMMTKMTVEMYRETTRYSQHPEAPFYKPLSANCVTL